MKTIHEEMEEKAQLAFVYGRDGAPRSAARIFQEIADTYKQRADEIDELIMNSIDIDERSN